MPVRVLVATAAPYGLTMALRDAGFEVIYVGEQPVDALVAAAEQEDAAAVVVTVTDPELAGTGLRVVEAGERDFADVVALLR